jgi:hypothetical protein
MKIIEIVALSNGAHRNQGYHGILPEGWAVVPDDIVCDNFPFGEAEVAEINGVMIVTKWTPGEIPVVEPEEPVEPVVKEPTTKEVLNALLGVTE